MIDLPATQISLSRISKLSRGEYDIGKTREWLKARLDRDDVWQKMLDFQSNCLNTGYKHSENIEGGHCIFRRNLVHYKQVF